MAEPPDQVPATAGRGHRRASHGDREQVIDILKAAFVHGMLAKDEFDLRVGQAFASRTRIELSALTADLPARLTAAQPPGPGQAPGEAASSAVRDRDRGGNRALRRHVAAGARLAQERPGRAPGGDQAARADHPHLRDGFGRGRIAAARAPAGQAFRRPLRSRTSLALRHAATIQRLRARGRRSTAVRSGPGGPVLDHRATRAPPAST